MRRSQQLVAAALTLAWLAALPACSGNGPAPTATLPAMARVSFASPSDPRYSLTMEVPENWNRVSGEDEREFAFTDGDTTVQVRFEGRPVDWMGYPDAVTMMREYKIEMFEIDLSQFEITESTRGVADGYNTEIVEFQHLLDGETVNGIAYIRAIPHIVIISTHSITKAEPYALVKAMIDSVELIRQDG